MNVKRTRPVVAVDGPAGAGKSSVCMRLAAALGYRLIDTGAIYRSVALAATEAGTPFDDDDALGALVATLSPRFETGAAGNRVFLGDRDVSDAIRTPEVSRAASVVSARPAVREGLLDLQRRLGADGGVVLEGRDIGTVVFPDAEVKIFLTATERERARRRHEELRAKGVAVTLEATLADVRERDRQDTTRAVAPLRKADDAIEVVTDGMTMEQVVARLVELVRDSSPAD